MNHHPFPVLDPELKRITRRSHLTLFTVGSILVIPAAFVLYLVGSIIKGGVILDMGIGNLAMIAAAAISSLTGSWAWIALGLLLLRPAYPRWHRACWPFVMLFGIVSMPCSILWICLEPGGISPLSMVAGFVLLTAIYSVSISARNLKRSRSALLRAGSSPTPVAS